MANRFMAGFQSRSGILHFFEADIIAKYIILQADLSLGKIFLFLIAFLITLFKDSKLFFYYSEPLEKLNTLLRINGIKFNSEWEKFGITIKTDNRYFYQCAFHSESCIPQFEHAHIPAGSYAKFIHTGQLYSLSKTINQIYKTIIPSSPLDIDLNRSVIHYERYDSRFNWKHQNSIIEIYVQLQN